MFSPFLPMNQQLEQQRQLEIMSQGQGLAGSGLSELGYGMGMNIGTEESLYRLNSDLPAAQLYADETTRSINIQKQQ